MITSDYDVRVCFYLTLLREGEERHSEEMPIGNSVLIHGSHIHRKSIQDLSKSSREISQLVIFQKFTYRYPLHNHFANWANPVHSCHDYNICAALSLRPKINTIGNNDWYSIEIIIGRPIGYFIGNNNQLLLSCIIYFSLIQILVLRLRFVIKMLTRYIYKKK